MRSEKPADGTGAQTGPGAFEATHWSLVMQACRSQSRQAGAALEALCRLYWHPIYHFIRRQGFVTEDAKDLTQAFFERFLEKGYLRTADPNRGRFRSFLLSCLRHFLSDARDYALAQKRGGQAIHVPLDWTQAERQFQTQLLGENQAEQLYDRSWALAVLEAARQGLRRHYIELGRFDRYEALAGYLVGEEGCRPYSEVASELGMSEAGVKTEVRRMRVRFRDLLRLEVAKTVGRSEEIDEEIRYLVRIV